MINISKLEKIVNDQSQIFKKKDIGVPRAVNFKKHLKTKQITVISGIRRSGKSTLLSQFAREYSKYYYLNFDDERLINFTVEDFENLMMVFQKKHKAKVIFLDEIQNISKWERFVRRIFEEGYKIFVTGSNAKLLSSELATHLTGRYFKIELFPFSFLEYLNFKKINYKKKDTKTEVKILKNFDKYLKNGGFPEFIKYNDPEFIKRIYENILYKDLLARFKIRETKAFKELANYLFSNFTKEASYNSLKNILGFKNVMTVRNYVSFMEESYLLFELYKYDYSLKKQYVFNKKIYVIDNGIRNIVSFYFSEDRGKLLENLVFIELKRQGKEIYFYRDKVECDFLIFEKNKITKIIQVTDTLDANNEKRELKGLLEAAKQFNLKQGFILTKNQEYRFQKDGVKIKVVPTWKWLLGIYL